MTAVLALVALPVGIASAREAPRRAPDQVVETFEIAEPGKDFAIYSEARLTRIK